MYVQCMYMYVCLYVHTQAEDFMLTVSNQTLAERMPAKVAALVYRSQFASIEETTR